MKVKVTILAISILLGTTSIFTQMLSKDSKSVATALEKSDEEFTKWLETKTNKQLLTFFEPISEKGIELHAQAKYRLAENAFKKCEKIARKLSDRFKIAESMLNMGRTQVFRRKFRESLDNLQKSEKILLELDTKEAKEYLVIVWEDLIYSYGIDGQKKKLLNIAWDLRAFGIKENMPKAIAAADQALNFYVFQFSNLTQASAFLEDAFENRVRAKDPGALRSTSKSLLQIYQALGEYKLGREELEKTEHYVNQSGDPFLKATRYVDIADFEYLAGRIKLARKYWTLSLEASKAVEFLSNKSIRTLITRINLAASYIDDNPRLAITQINQIRGEIAAEKNRVYYKITLLQLLAEAQTNLGKIREAMTNLSKAEASIIKAQEFINDNPSKYPHKVKNQLEYLKNSQIDASVNSFFAQSKWLKAYEAISKLKKTDTLDLYTALQYSKHGLAGFRSGKLSIDKALDLTAQSIQIVEALKRQVLPVNLKPSSSNITTEIYRNHMVLLREKRYLEDAIIASDSSKSRGLLDKISNNEFYNYPNNWLVSDEAKKLRAEIVKATVKNHYVKTPETKKHMQSLIDLHDTKYADFKKQRLKSTNYSQAYIKKEEIERLLKANPDVIFLSYSFSNDDLVAFILKDGKPIKTISISLSDKQAQDKILMLKKSLKAFDPKYKKLSKELYKLLIKPVEKEIQSSKHLIISLDGVLWSLPFQILLDETDKFLIEKYPISYTPSLKVLSALLAKSKSEMMLRDHYFIGFGNPVNKAVVSLPEAETELTSIANLFSNKSVYLKSKASEAEVKKGFSKAEILHIAAHGKLDTDEPLKSALYLSSDKSEDGVLNLSEIVNLKTNAELVVLSACETSDGKTLSDEGMLSLSWGFLLAGSRSIISTQWSVESKSTSINMLQFYKELLKGKNKAEALQAMMKMQIKASPPYNHPYYWGSYVSIGDFR